MTTLDHINAQIAQIEARVTELSDRKQRLLDRVSNLFDEDSASVTAELSSIESKLGLVPKQLSALKTQRTLLELDALTAQVQPLYDEKATEHDRLKGFQAWLYTQERLVQYAKSQQSAMTNQRLPGIRNRIYALFKALREHGLSEEAIATLKAGEPMAVSGFKGFTGQEQAQMGDHARRLFHDMWGVTPAPAPIMANIPNDLLPEHMRTKNNYITPNLEQFNYEQSQREAANARELQAMMQAERERLGNVLGRFE